MLYKKIFKRIFDVVISFVGLAVLSPILVVIAAAISLDSSGGVLYRSERVGLNGRHFRLYKFRSMQPNTDREGFLNVGNRDPRITRIGHILRNTKLDELVQLFNVFVGNMSLVGPRPELPFYVASYTSEQRCILNVKPGVTDWASIVHFAQFDDFTKDNDPDAYYTSHIQPTKLKLQQYYAERYGLLMDCRCLWWTILKLFTRTRRLPKDIRTVIAAVSNDLEDGSADQGVLLT
ncbi:hypothetical protein AGMMS49992_27810 [Clostridia bacterium]|nr:hypothetical protein AGMMS49992_27810 [Clostridia bacterium]